MKRIVYIKSTEEIPKEEIPKEEIPKEEIPKEKNFLVCLTVWKRNTLKFQLEAIKNQTIQPKFLIVFQNENHVNIEKYKKDFSFIHLRSDYNTKFFGRFAYCFTFPVDYCIIMDDDIVPNKNCFKRFLFECEKRNGIMGGNGRSGNNNKNGIRHSEGVTRHTQLIDFVGHLWCFKKEWLHYMFTIKPYTYETGEDMHFCFSAKILGNIKSYVCGHANESENNDTTKNAYHGDQYAATRTTPRNLRLEVEKYFVENYKLEFINREQFKKCTYSVMGRDLN